MKKTTAKIYFFFFVVGRKLPKRFIRANNDVKAESSILISGLYPSTHTSNRIRTGLAEKVYDL